MRKAGFLILTESLPSRYLRPSILQSSLRFSLIASKSTTKRLRRCRPEMLGRQVGAPLAPGAEFRIPPPPHELGCYRYDANGWERVTCDTAAYIKQHIPHPEVLAGLSGVATFVPLFLWMALNGAALVRRNAHA